MTIVQGWEVSPDRVGMYEKMATSDEIGDPIATSKCKLDKENGFLIITNNGIAWRIRLTAMRGSLISAGKSKWIRWYDVIDIILKKPGQVLMQLKLRKKGALIIDKNGNIKIKKFKLTLAKSKGEDAAHFKGRQEAYFQMMMVIFQSNTTDVDPEISDSRM